MSVGKVMVRGLEEKEEVGRWMEAAVGEMVDRGNGLGRERKRRMVGRKIIIDREKEHE